MKYILILFIGILFGSCFNEGDCLVTATNFMDIQFRKRTNTTLDSSVQLTMVQILGITKSGEDTVLFTTVYKPVYVTSEIALPVDIHNNITAFKIQHRAYPDTTLFYIDSLRVSYTSQSKLITTNCGAYTYYQNLKVISTSPSLNYRAFSTSLIKNPTDSAYAVNFQIYY